MGNGTDKVVGGELEVTDLQESRMRRITYFTGISFIAALGGFLFGFDTAVISGTIGFLENQFSLTPLMEGWVVSSALVGCIVGVSFAGTLSDRFGRKRVLILSASLFLLSAVGSSLAKTEVFLVLARLVGGMGVGIASMLSPLFISEFSPPRYRGRMVSFYQLAITLGIVGAYFSNALLLQHSQNLGAASTGNFWHWIFVSQVWRGMFGAETVPAIIFLLLLLIIPESPRWLTAQGETEQAMSILSRVSGRSVAEKEMEEIRVTVHQEGGSLRHLLRPGLRVALIIGILLPFFAQASGINVIIYYGPKIFNTAGFTLSDAFGGQVTIGIVNTLSTFIAIWQIDNFGRRPLLYTGITGVVLALVFVGIFFSLGITQGIWLLVFFLLFIVCFAFSLGPIPFVVISEIFPTRVRGRAMSVATFSLWITNALVVQMFPWLLENLGAAGTFWLYAVVCAPAVLLVWKLLPETKGKSLEEIEQHWKNLEEASL